MLQMKDAFVIQGLGGKRTLQGKISVMGAKNAALKAMAAAILFKDPLKVENVPQIEDISRLGEVLEFIGAKVEVKDRTRTITVPDGASSALPEEIAKRFRGSVVLTGPLLARFGRVTMPHPGGCVIGKRPIDIFLEGFEKMGATVTEHANEYQIDASKEGLQGVDLFLRVPSVTATETFLMAGVLANGKTTIRNVALEPEVQALAEFLNACGAKIEGIGTPTLEIEGGGLLESGGKSYITPPDRIEAGSFAILAALSGKDVEISPVVPLHIEALLETFREMNIPFELSGETLRIEDKRGGEMLPTQIKTHEYPGFPTDLQAPMTVLLTQAKGESPVFETIFEGRLNYTEELTWMGADILTLDPHRVLVRGKSALRGRKLESPDLRAGIAYVIAAISATGESVIGNAYNIDRGYERLEERLSGIGVDIKRVAE